MLALRRGLAAAAVRGGITSRAPAWRAVAALGDRTHATAVSVPASRRAAVALAAGRRHASTESGVTPPHASESFLSGTNSIYMEEMYRLWQEDPKSVHASWDVYFRGVEGGAGPGSAFIAPPHVQPGVAPVAAAPGASAHGAGVGGGSGVSARINYLARAYQVRGHQIANLDPLKLKETPMPPELDHKSYGFTDADLEREFPLAGFGGVVGFLSRTDNVKLKDLIDLFRGAYSDTIGWEYMHIQSREICNWLRARIESPRPELSKEEKHQILERTCYADHFERFLANKWSASKRFGLEGCESLIAGIKACVDEAVRFGCDNLVIGMPHRGRLNVLSNVVRKPNELIFREFGVAAADLTERDAAEAADADWSGSGDVKYHLGTSFDRTYPDGRKIHISLMANPSHLEAVNPLVAGKVRAKQDKMGDDGTRVMGMLLHGDAAFAGQGVVYETLHMAMLEHYKTGGTIHVVCNNQIGFTTNPDRARSSEYCSDVGKAFEVPIFHVNADDPEATHFVMKLAAEYRATFKRDVIVDMIGYRRYGHNELDQPMFTQPKMYTKIQTHPPVADLYKQRLISEGSFAPEEVEAVSANVYKTLESAFEASATYKSKEAWLDSNWKGFMSPKQLSRIRATGVPLALLQDVGSRLTALPEGFSVHKNLKRILQAKAKTITEGKGLDWSSGEALAWATLLLEGNRVRISGQDVERGTFSHRHAVVHDQYTWAEHCFLKNLGDGQAPFQVCNSPLSEFGVLGFEVGYALEDPNQLVMWEAQFGDFSNGAQVIIDQFISAGETKWLRQLGLVMMLPHGYDGQGPEHSSCRMERFLQLTDEAEDEVPDMDEDKRRQIQNANWQVVNITTPANYFHVLRRQIHRDFRKPLVVMSPKALLRHKGCVSDLSDMAEGTKFQRVLHDAVVSDDSKVRKVIFCTGKVYYDLAKEREERGLNDEVAIARLEQIAPFPWDRVAAEAARFPDAKVVWCQEEPQNMGAWSYVHPRMETAFKHFNSTEVKVKYAGRHASASPATGSNARHHEEQAKLVNDALA